MKNILKFLVIGWCFALVTGCSTMSNHMAISQQKNYEPKADKALIVFMRPSALGAAVQATLYDVTSSEVQFIGVSSYETKIPYYVEPGSHTFMVVGESADFMQANVEAGKTYYAVVSPRMGFWKARFSLKPVRGSGADEFTVTSKAFANWDKSCQFVSKNASAEAWYSENIADIKAKRAKYWPAWQSKPAEEQMQQTLTKNDGI